MSTPELTVVVPLYNGQRFIAATLDSLARQRDVDLEVLVVDDGSQDDSPASAAAHPVGARVIRQRNLGVAVARNRGLAEARAPWAAFVDQDDLWHPARARALLDLADRRGAAWVASTERPFAVHGDRGALQALGDGRENWPDVYVDEGAELDQLVERAPVTADVQADVEEISFERFLQAPATLTTAFIFDRVTALSAGGCAAFVRALDDHVFYLNMARIAGPAVRVQAPLLYYRVHPSSATVSSPLVKAYLSTMLAVRWGRVFPADAAASEYVEHLLGQLPASGLPRAQQLALLELSAARHDRARLARRWAISQARRTARRAVTGARKGRHEGRDTSAPATVS